MLGRVFKRVHMIWSIHDHFRRTEQEQDICNFSTTVSVCHRLQLVTNTLFGEQGVNCTKFMHLPTANMIIHEQVQWDVMRRTFMHWTPLQRVNWTQLFFKVLCRVGWDHSELYSFRFGDPTLFQSMWGGRGDTRDSDHDCRIIPRAHFQWHFSWLTPLREYIIFTPPRGRD
jgi:hypothetical protein